MSHIEEYFISFADQEAKICQSLVTIIDAKLPYTERKIWHAHPVWFIDGNPIVGFSKQKKGIRLMFWSGADFEDPLLYLEGKKFKDASIFYTTVDEIKPEDVERWLLKASRVQWDYKNLIKRKGKLLRLK